MKTIDAQHLLDVESLQDCIRGLQDGFIICYPTETFYALGIDPENPAARERLYAAKLREESKDLPLIAADIEMVTALCGTNHPAFASLTARFWPGPLTLVLPLRDVNGNCAIRVSSHSIARQLSAAFAKPIVSTSANVSGQPPICEIRELNDQLRTRLAVALDAGPAAGGKPSTIVSLVDPTPKILREGAIAVDEIKKLL